MRIQAITAAQSFIHEKFSGCDMAFLAGSAARGEETKTSDLDIVIFDANKETYRESFVMFGWRIETFVHNWKSYLEQFEVDRDNGRPILANMLFECIIIKDGGSAEKIKEQAGVYLSKGPTPLSEEYISASRYFIYDLLDDIIDSQNHEEALITINTLSLQLADFILRVNRQWSGRGKGLSRALKKYDQELCEQYFNALNRYYQNKDKQALVEFVNQIYQPLGGQLFEGFSQGKY